jgi:hypothetical protein
MTTSGNRYSHRGDRGHRADPAAGNAGQASTGNDDRFSSGVRRVHDVRRRGPRPGVSSDGTRDELTWNGKASSHDIRPIRTRSSFMSDDSEDRFRCQRCGKSYDYSVYQTFEDGPPIWSALRQPRSERARPGGLGAVLDVITRPARPVRGVRRSRRTRHDGPGRGRARRRGRCGLRRWRSQRSTRAAGRPRRAARPSTS